jgi:5-methylcytosine-specific restriction endonuclease McrA
VTVIIATGEAARINFFDNSPHQTIDCLDNIRYIVFICASSRAELCTLNTGGCIMSTAVRSLSNSDLLKNTKQVVARERGITIEVLDHLNEVEWRKLYLALGYSSMFAYCTGELGYSASAAKRRISTARCIARFPEALPLLKVNEINLSTITQVSKIINEENSHDLLQRIRGKSQNDVEGIVAEFEPLSALPRDRARTVVVRVPVNASSSVAPRKPEPATQSTNVPAMPVQDRNGPEPETQAPPAMRLERRAVVQFSAREEVMTKLERVRALASHRLPINAPMEQVIEFLADYFTRREDPKERHERRQTRSEAQRPVTPNASSARSIPLAVRDEVFVRGAGTCSFVGPDGRRCGSPHVVQVDHIRPVAKKGSASIENLRLLCAEHNRMEWERLTNKHDQVRNGPELDIK